MENGEFHTVRGYQLLEPTHKNLTSAMEDYLEMIYRNSIKEGYIRINILAGMLHVSAASASRMVQRLSELGLLNYKKYGIIILSENGRKIGEFLLERHRIIENFLSLIGCDEDLLQQTELMEHSINGSTLNKLLILNHFLFDNKELYEQYPHDPDKY